MTTVHTPTDTRISRPAVGLVVLLAILPYLNALTAGFTLDDWRTIRENPAATTGGNLTEIFASPLLVYLYRPVTVLTFALNEGVAPGNAMGFHLLNVLLHAAVTVLVYWLGVQLFAARIALIAAVLFALHPLHTEAVTSIVGRAELLAALFGLFTLLAAGAADAAVSGWAKRGWYGLSVLCFALAVFSKENAVTVLPLLLLYRVTRRGEPLIGGLWKDTWSLYWVPYALSFGVFMYFRFLVVGTLAGVPTGRVHPLDNVLAFVPWPLRVWSSLGILWDYFGLLNLPLVLSADYSFNQVPVIESWFDPRCMAGSLLVAAAVVGAVWARRPALRFAAAFPLVALLLTANLLFPIGTVKAERLLYLPSIGWALLVACAFDRLLRVARYRAACTAIVALVCVAFGARTWVRNGDWQNHLSLFESTARSAPNSAKAQYNFGSALQEAGQSAAAIAQFEGALAIAPWTSGAALGLGMEYEKRGDVDDAVNWYRKAIASGRDSRQAHTNLCHVLLSTERYAEATAACRDGLRYHPTDANMLKGLGEGLLALGDTAKGIDVLGRSLALNPGDNELRHDLAALGAAAVPHDTVMEARG